MERHTFDATIRAYKHRKPFHPFTVVTVDGDRHEVDYAEAIAIRDGLALFAAPGNIPVIFDYGNVSQVIGGLAGSPSE